MQQEMAAQTRNLWALIYPASDVPGQWVAHCLDHDIVTVGNSARHASEMLTEAVVLSATEDVKAGRDPFGRSRAPSEDWVELDRIIREGEFRQGEIPADEATQANCIIALQLMLIVDVPERHAPSAKRQPVRWGIQRDRLQQAFA